MIRQRPSFRSVLVATGAIALATQTATGQTNPHECLFCHAMHNAPGPTLTIAEDVEVLCLTCHGPAGTSVLKADVHTNAAGSPYPPFRMTCVDCHTPHSSMTNWLGGVNIKQVGTNADGQGIARINTPNSDIREVVFESRGTDAGEPTLHSFADNDEDGNGYYDGVCETCHTQTGHHRNDAADPDHYPGATCTTCHPHDAGFVPSGGNCADCHNTAQDNGDGVPPGGRRAVIGEFALASHHLQGETLDEADCIVCHDMSQHQQGSVRLKNVDDPGNPALVVTLTGDPAADATEAVKLEPFCLACHDADGAGGSVPFSDGITPVALDSSLWANAAHKLGGAVQLTCFGDGETFGCHSSGHGSNKRKLLAPYELPPTPPANAEEEEGFCFTCHDADGPALSDVMSPFSTPIRWVTAPAGDFNSNDLNDRHDVQYEAQSRSGAKVECTDCHDPHTATQTAPLKSDPDPADGRTPGTGEILPGADLQTEWCLDCHDGSFPAAVTPPSTALMDVRGTFQNDDAHGLPSGNPVLKSGYGWAAGDLVPCAACHTGHHVSSNRNLFQVKDEVRSEDGTVAIPSDDVGLNYELTDNNTRNTAINGYEWCNTCHTGSMGQRKRNCFACHYHGQNF